MTVRFGPHVCTVLTNETGSARGQDVVALPSLLVADHQRLQLRVAAVKAAGRDVELPSQPAAPAAPERPAGGAAEAVARAGAARVHRVRVTGPVEEVCPPTPYDAPYDTPYDTPYDQTWPSGVCGSRRCVSVVLCLPGPRRAHGLIGRGALLL